MHALQVIPIPYEAAAFLFIGVGLFCWIWIVIDIAKLMNKQRKGEETDLIWNPLTKECESKSVRTQKHTYTQVFFVGLFFFAFGIFVLFYTGVLAL